MPTVASWNGRWSGEGNLYCIVRRFTDKIAEPIMTKPSYYYNFGDGWSAQVSVKRVDNAEARTLRKASKGFCGYDWMVDSIVSHGRIIGARDTVETATK